MSKRGRRSGEGSSSQPASPHLVIPLVDGVPMFANIDVYRNYMEKFATRTVVRERGINTGEGGERLAVIIDYYELNELVFIPDVCNGSITREIFAHLATYPSSSTVTIRGTTFQIDSHAINRILGMHNPPTGPDEYTRAVHNLNNVDSMVNMAAEMGITWPLNNQGNLAIFQVGWFPNEWKPVFRFIANRIFHSGHSSTAPKETVELMHWLGTFKPVNFGDLIMGRLKKVAKSNAKELGYCALLTKIALDAGVHVYPTDEKTRKGRDIGEGGEDEDLPFDPPVPTQAQPRVPRVITNELLYRHMQYITDQMNWPRFDPDQDYDNRDDQD